ncbi:MAG: MlaD family protein [Polyangiaceae bacterium]
MPLEPPTADDEEALPRARIEHRHGFSWIWLVPLAALALVAYLGYTLVSRHGPLVSLSFKTADGLTAKQTQVRYKAVTLGTVDSIRLSEDSSHVVVTVRMTSEAEPLLTSQARFWVVRPQLTGGLSAIQSGLDALVSGAYVALDPGPKGGRDQRSFEGLEAPPSVRSDEPGTVYFLTAPSVGGLSPGAPVYYRDVNVGELLSFELEQESVKLRIFVHAPYDRHIVAETRFWNSSGFSIDTGAEGLRVQLQSVRTLLSGGIAFRTPSDAEGHPQSAAQTNFQLYDTRRAAEVGFYTSSVPFVSYFQSSVNGLGVGSEVQIFGRTLGAVTDVALARDPREGHAGQLAARVAYVLQPERALEARDRDALSEAGMHALVKDQLRVVLASSNLLTGQKVLSLEYVPGAHAARLEREGDALVLPSQAAGIEALSSTLNQVAAKVNQIPFAEIGEHLNGALSSLQSTVGGPELRHALASLDSTLAEVGSLAREAKTDLGPALARLPAISQKLEGAISQANAAFGQNGYGTDSAVQRDLQRTMGEVGDAARSIRLLADYLNRHPESALRGRGTSEP